MDLWERMHGPHMEIITTLLHVENSTRRNHPWSLRLSHPLLTAHPAGSAGLGPYGCSQYSKKAQRAPCCDTGMNSDQVYQCLLLWEGTRKKMHPQQKNKEMVIPLQMIWATMYNDSPLSIFELDINHFLSTSFMAWRNPLTQVLLTPLYRGVHWGLRRSYDQFPSHSTGECQTHTQL